MKGFTEVKYEEIVRQTDDAILFDIYGDGKKQVWIPKSNLEHYEDEKSFSIPDWMAIKKELDL